MDSIFQSLNIILTWYKKFKNDTIEFVQDDIVFVNLNELDIIDTLIIYTLILIAIYKFYKNYIKKQPNEEKSFFKRIYLKVFRSILQIGFIEKRVEKFTAKQVISFDEEFNKSVNKKTFKIPDNGMTQEKVQERLLEFTTKDTALARTSKLSGTVYISADKKFEQGQVEFAKNFMFSNPLHFDSFPGVRQMEAEVIRMTGDLFGCEKEAIGIFTSGGTESILLSVLAYRNWAKQCKGITEPNLVLPETAHVAFIRACEYFQIDARRAPVDKKTQKANVSQMRKLIDSNTIALICSVPSYGSGTMDPVADISELARKYNIGCHVDACLGGFIIAFQKDRLPKFDFSLPGVTSISVDNHKYGLSVKGASTALFRTKPLRRFAFFTNSNWSGGFYLAPTMAGSRGSAGIAGAWYALVSVGKKRYTELAQNIMDTTQNIVQEINSIPELQVLGDPKICAIAFMSSSKSINIFAIHQILNHKGWNLSTLQKPSAIHISLTHQNSMSWKILIQDIKDSVQEIKQNPGKYKGSTMGAIYGTAQSIPDSKLLDDAMKQIIECSLKI